MIIKGSKGNITAIENMVNNLIGLPHKDKGSSICKPVELVDGDYAMYICDHQDKITKEWTDKAAMVSLIDESQVPYLVISQEEYSNSIKEN